MEGDLSQDVFNATTPSIPSIISSPTSSNNPLLGGNISLTDFNPSQIPSTQRFSNISPIASGSISPLIGDSTPIRRGPGRPRKDGQGLFMRKSQSVGSVRQSHVSRPQVKSQLSAGVRGRSALGSSFVGGAFLHQKSYYSSTSSPSADSSSPGTPNLMEPMDPNESPFMNLQSNSGAVVQNNSQKCAFCYLTASSLLGQGDLIRFNPTLGAANPSQVVLKKGTSSASPIADESQQNPADPNLTLRINLKHSRVVRARKKFDNYVTEDDEIFDEMENVGLPDEIEPVDVFEKTGHFYAHHCCVAWSDSMIPLKSGEFELVDQAVLTAMTERCAGCYRFGASISCRADNCTKKYHYPCASAHGTFQDLKSIALFCPDHIDQAIITGMETQCAACSCVKDLDQILFCTSCGQHYHSYCLTPPLQPLVSVRAGWQCPDCKSCQLCKNTNDDSKMLVCDVCDKGYHTYCVQPQLTTVPKHGWKCKNCRRCTDCQSRTPGSGQSSRWHMNYTVCDSCYQQRNKGLACPICRRAYRHCKQKSMRECIQCRKHVHMDCDPLPTETSHYICRLCKDTNSCRDQTSSCSMDQSYAGYSNQSSTYSADDHDEEILAAILKNEINSETFSGTESPFSDLDLANMDIAGSNFNLDWALGIEEGVNFGAAGERSLVSSATVPKKAATVGVPRKRFSAYKRSKSNGSNVAAVRGKGRRNSKGRGAAGCGVSRSAVQTLTAMITSHNAVAKHKEDDEYIHTVVVSSSKDSYVFCQDMCVICGSLGDGPESHLIACMQCGQCYHTYCANVKYNSVIIRRGWRCLDCTVCEGCGQGDDEQHLLLCDECDVSVHTYCLDPPLDSIPSGAWRCSWCSCCLICDGPMTSIGVDAMENCKICGSCASLSCCSLCRTTYRDGELIIKCEKCKKWCHGKCNGLTSEELLDKACESSFTCLMCKPGYQHGVQAGQAENLDKNEYSQYLDGVALTKVGVSTVRWRPRAPPAPPRPSSGGSQCIDDVIDSVTALVKKRTVVEEPTWDDHFDGAESFDGMSVDVNADGQQNSSVVDNMQISPGEKHKKVRYRKNMKIGVGGFIARTGRQRSIADKNMAPPGDDLGQQQEASTELQDSADVDDASTDKPKKRKRNRKKGHLDDNYPQYIQDAFFVPLNEKTSTIGENLTILDEQTHATTTNAVGNSSEISVDVIKNLEKKSTAHAVRRPSSNAVAAATAHHEPSMSEQLEDFGEDQDIFPDHLQSASDFSNILELLMKEDMDQDASGKARQSPDDKNLENLIDNGVFVGIGAIDSAEMDRFMDSMLASELRGVAGPSAPQPPVAVAQPQDVGRLQPTYSIPHPAYVGRQEMMAQPAGHIQQFVGQQPPITPVVEYGQDASSFFGQEQMSADMNVPVHQTSDGNLSIKRESPPPSGGDLKSSMERWEQDEPLGVQATTAAVLYANLHHADLKSKYPAWNERSKQIAKLWRTLSPEQRQQFVLLARENRTASRQVAKGKKVPPSKTIEVSGRSTEPKLPMTPMTPSTPAPPFADFIPQYGQQQSAPAIVEYGDSQAVSRNHFFPDVRHWNQNQPLLLDDLVELERREQISRTISVPSTPAAMPTGPQQASHRWLPAHGSPPQPMGQQPAVHQQAFVNQPTSYQQPSNASVASQQPPAAIQQTVQPPPRDLYLENDLLKNQHELDSQQKILETQLNQLRRSKKNSASKQRQMRKNNVEPPEQDQQTLARLSKDISDRQKQLEQIKKHAKANSNQMQEYQQKHGLLPPTPQQAQPAVPAGQQVPARGPMSPVAAPAGFPMGVRGGQSPGAAGVSARQSQPPPVRQQFSAPLGMTQQPVMPFTGPSNQIGAQYRVCPGDNNPFSEGFALEPRMDRRFERPVFHDGPQVAYGQFPSSAVLYDTTPKVPEVVPSNFCPMPGQHGSPVVPFASSLVPQEPDIVKKPKKKYGKKKKQPDAAAIGDSGDSYGSTVFSPRTPYPSVSIKNVPFLDIPAPKTTAVLIKSSSDRSDSQATYRSDLQAQPPKVFDSQSSTGCRNLISSPSLRIKSESIAGLRLQIDDPGSMDADVVEVVHLLIERVALVLEGGDESGENLLLKSLLQNSPVSLVVEDEKKEVSEFGSIQTKPGNKRAHAVGGQGSPRKRQRKNAKQKIAQEISNGDDFSAFLEQLANQLKQAPPLGVHEPMPRPDPHLCSLTGVTVLADKPSKPIIAGNRVGSLKSTFMPDYYNETFGVTPVKTATGHGPVPGMVPFGRIPITNAPPANHNLIPNEKPTPDSLLSLDPRSESPLELVYGNAQEPDEEVLPAYPALKPGLPSDGRLSPNFRLMAHVPMRSTPADPPFGSLAEQNSKLVPANHQQFSDTIGVTLTLDADAANNVQNVLRGLAMLLNIDCPQQFEIHMDTPPHTPEKAELREFVEAQQMFCRHCDVAVQQAMVKKKFAELGLTPKDDDNDEVVFCSPACYMQFAVNARAASPHVKDSQVQETETEKFSKSSTTCESLPQRMSIEDTVAASVREVKRESVGFMDDGRLDEIIRSVVGGSLPYGGTTREEVVHVKELPRLSITGVDDGFGQGKYATSERRWKGNKWTNWTTSMRSKVAQQLNKDVEQFWHEMTSMLFRSADFPADTRICELCSSVGDGSTFTCGRLLNYDAGRWVHVNCALWSAEVYETMDGGLVNVEQAVRRSLSTVCCRCSKSGATVPCYKLRCELTFHFQCALDFQCSFMKDKTMFCPEHSPQTNENVLSNLSVLRKIYIDRDENRLLAKLYQQGYSGQFTLRVGSLIFKNIGQLLPHQLRQFSNKDFIFPVGYEVFRIYWSCDDVRRRNLYKCGIGESESTPEFSVSYSNSDSIEVSIHQSTATDVWSKAIKSIESMRIKNKMLKIFSQYLPGESLFGLNEPCVQKMIESLPGVDSLVSYEFKFGRHPLMDLPLAVNPSGCARCEPRFRTYIKRPHTLNASTQHSVHSLLALSGISLESSPYGNRQALQSKWSQYRKMKSDWKNVVYLARSKIQGLGLYAKRDIEMNAMIIEYIGEVIRNEVAERREKQYQDHRHGIYMFRIDHERVLDATMTGGPARYVNHSCDPNCVTELMEFDRGAKIIIMSCRPISKGEELTYDYQFDFEDDIHKIPCLCGAPHCRKWMN